jgi:hypothetical protein
MDKILAVDSLVIQSVVQPTHSLIDPDGVFASNAFGVPGDAAATAMILRASEPLFLLGIVSALLVQVVNVFVALALYRRLKPVSKTLSLVAAFSRLAITIIQGINLLNHFFVLLLLSGATYLTVFAPDQFHALVLLFLNAHESVVLIWGLFFGFHLLVLGYLVYKSGYLPKIIGVLLILASLCYLTQNFGNILLPNYKEIFASVGYLSIVEIALPLWLLIKGVIIELWEKRALESA